MPRATVYTTQAKIISRLGDIKISDQLDIQEFVDRAANETDAALAGVYTIPLTGMSTEASGEMSEINADLAAAYLILSLAAATQSEGTFALAQDLKKSSRDKLMEYRTGKKIIVGAEKDTTLADNQRYTPKISVRGPDAKLGSRFSDIYPDFDKKDTGSFQYPRRREPW
jgi:hypothetical protein